MATPMDTSAPRWLQHCEPHWPGPGECHPRPDMDHFAGSLAAERVVEAASADALARGVDLDLDAIEIEAGCVRGLARTLATRDVGLLSPADLGRHLAAFAEAYLRAVAERDEQQGGNAMLESVRASLDLDG